jgi:hypothetical protein
MRAPCVSKSAKGEAAMRSPLLLAVCLLVLVSFTACQKEKAV